MSRRTQAETNLFLIPKLRNLLFFWLILSVPLFGQSIEKIKKKAEFKGNYLVISPGIFHDTLKPLLQWRKEQGYQTHFITTEDIYLLSKNLSKDSSKDKDSSQTPENQSIRNWLQTWQDEFSNSPRNYLLLVGDAAPYDGSPADYPTVPSFYVSTLFSHHTVSDYPYLHRGAGKKRSLRLGRLPVRETSQLDEVVAKIIRYEREHRADHWQKRLSFIAGEGNFGASTDAFCEFLFQRLLSSFLPRSYDVRITYANPNSPYYFPAAKFPGIVRQRMQEGSLLFVYVGHGFSKGFGIIQDQNQYYPIFDLRHAQDLKGQKGNSPVVSLACTTAAFDLPQMGIGEKILLQRKGPVAFIGSTRISHPYANALLGKAFLRGLFQEKCSTAGDLLFFAQKELIQPPQFDFWQGIIDGGAKLFVPHYAGGGNLAQIRQEHLYLYHLLGDPATPLFLPKTSLDIHCEKKSPNRWSVSLASPNNFPEGSPVLVSWEIPLPKLHSEFFQNSNSPIKSYHLANKKTIIEVKGKIEKGNFQVSLTPGQLAPGEYIVKVALIASNELYLGYKKILLAKQQ